MIAISDPLGQTHSPASSDNYSRLKVVLFCELLNIGNGRTYVQTTCVKKVNTTVTLPLWVGLVDQ